MTSIRATIPVAFPFKDFAGIRQKLRGTWPSSLFKPKERDNRSQRGTKSRIAHRRVFASRNHLLSRIPAQAHTTLCSQKQKRLYRRAYLFTQRPESLNHSNPAIYSTINVSLTSIPIYRLLHVGQENPTSSQTTKDSTTTIGRRRRQRGKHDSHDGIHDYRKRSRNLRAIIHPLALHLLPWQRAPSTTMVS